MEKGKVILFGLDGATWRILNPLMEQGLLPNLSRLCAEGAAGILKSTIPPVTPQAWSTIVTGKNPGKHGVFGFVMNKYRAGSKVSWMNESSIKTHKLWDFLDNTGRTSALINIPITYPARKINGWYISGFLSPRGAGDFAYPQGLMAEIDDAVGGYVVNVPVVDKMSVEAAENFTKLNLDCTAKRAETAFHLWDKHDPDLIFPVFVGPDRIQHRFHGYLDPDCDAYGKEEAVRFRNALIPNYVQIDEILGRVMQKMKSDHTLLVISDHGFTPMEYFVSSNYWLAQNGYFAFSKLRTLLWQLKKKFKVGGNLRNHPKLYANLTLDEVYGSLIDWSRTKAFTGDITEEGIYLNVKGRQENGIVALGEEYEEIRNGIISGLKSLKFPGENRHIFRNVFRREEVYTGPYVEDAPDIVVELDSHRSLIRKDISIFNPKLVNRSKNQAEGVHHPDGIFAAWGERISKADSPLECDLADVTPTVLHAMGEAYYSDMDGKPVTGIFKNAAAPGVAEPLESPEEETVYTEDEEKIIEERLRQLGYLD